MTKEEIKTALDEAKIDYDPTAAKADLEALLPVQPEAVAEVAPVVPEVAPEVVPEAPTERDARWQAHLERYKAQNPAKYAIKEGLGELKTPPASFQ